MGILKKISTVMSLVKNRPPLYEILDAAMDEDRSTRIRRVQEISEQYKNSNDQIKKEILALFGLANEDEQPKKNSNPFDDDIWWMHQQITNNWGQSKIKFTSPTSLLSFYASLLVFLPY